MSLEKKYNILILTYYFPPFNGVPGYRPYSWYKHFAKSGLKPTIICRNWKGGEKLWEDSIREDNAETSITTSDDSKLIFVPYNHSRLKKFSDKISRMRWLSKFYHTCLMVFGRFSVEIDADHAYKKFLNEYLQKNSFDAVIVSSPPHNLVRLGYKISKKHNIPFIADFRDIWDNDEMMQHYTPSGKIRFQNYLKKTYLSRWLKKAIFATTVSKPIAQKISTITKTPVKVITNGFEAEMFNPSAILPDKNKFTISVIGTMYPKQDLSIILDGLKQFVSETGESSVQINFIGTKAIQAICERIQADLPASCTFISDRIPREEAISFTQKSHVLLYAGWKKYSGIFSGKIFDYLGAKRNILLAPGDEDVLDQLIIDSRSGKIANSPAEFNTTLKNWYNEWVDKKEIAYFGLDEIILNYTRENQARLLAGMIISELENSSHKN
jgi:hypothetical protein